MKIITVTYAHLHNLGNFENIRLEWAAELEPGEDPAAATAQLGRGVRAALAAAAKAAAPQGQAWVYQDDDGGTIP